MNNLNLVIETSLKNGMKQCTIKELNSMLKKHGFKLDRSMDCKSVARYMTGELAGLSHAACSMRVSDLKGMMLCNANQVKNDDWQKAYNICQTYFCVVNDCIYDAI